jgi:ParB-like chromosome segregation protein Spo0J
MGEVLQLDCAVRLEALGDRLAGLRLCEPAAVAHMQSSLANVGQLSSIAVFAPEPGRLEVIDGFKRLRAAQALGWSALRAETLAVDAVGAKVALSALHERRGLSELEEAWLVRSLYREDGLAQPEIARRLSRHKSWVSRRLLIAEALEESVQADVRLGLLGASAAAALARLPRCNQAAAATAVAHTGATFRQTARLVEDVLACADERARAAVIEQWRVAPPAPVAPRPARRARSEAEWVMADIGSITRVAARLEARLLAQPLAAFGPRVGELCARALASLTPVLTALGSTITHVTGDPAAHALDHPRGVAAPSRHAEPSRALPARGGPGAVGQPQYGP